MKSLIFSIYWILTCVALARAVYDLQADIRNEMRRRNIEQWYYPRVTLGDALLALAQCFIPLWNAWLTLVAVFKSLGWSLDRIMALLDVPLIGKRKEQPHD